MHKLYEEWIDPKITFRKHIEESTAASYNRIASEIAALVAKFDRPPYSLKFLDFGMGWGEWVRLARAFGVQAHGAEFSQARLAFARSQALPVVTWDEISTQQFDLIRADQVFEHLAQPLATLQYLARSLKQGGVLKIGVPDGSDIRRRLLIDDWSAPKGSRNSLNAVAPLEHINCFSRNALLAMATKAGLRPVRSRLLLQYTHLILGRTPREILGNLCRPLLRQVLQQSNSILLTHQ
jgi:ubiquinone/menaquinone biosynthesis C-methylase UbiE